MITRRSLLRGLAAVAAVGPLALRRAGAVEVVSSALGEGAVVTGVAVYDTVGTLAYAEVMLPPQHFNCRCMAIGRIYFDEIEIQGVPRDLE